MQGAQTAAEAELGWALVLCHVGFALVKSARHENNAKLNRSRTLFMGVTRNYMGRRQHRCCATKNAITGGTGVLCGTSVVVHVLRSTKDENFFCYNRR
jgi:hypothetical protein